jgi:serine/threonine protein kinase
LTRRPPSPPPDLDGYTVTKLLGSGGFADVYLYEQRLPRRPVAVKVLVPGAADGELLAQFDAEANLMAALSTHPAIVTIHQAGVAADGRPYLVMEYCSRPNLSVRYRAERMSVAEVLRIGVRLSGAVETAHRAGILHRDIKPANVLTTDFGHPALTDFGISVHSAPSSLPSAAEVVPPSSGGTVGMSIPWTAPEVFAEGAGGDERADIYALAATLYTVLARRSPFDRPGGPNGSADLINRIRSSPVPPIGRSDVPASLERVLARAMDKNPAARYRTALDLGRALQQVETELRLAATPVDVLDEVPDAAELIGSDPVGGSGTPATRIRSLTVVDPQPEPMPRGPLRTSGSGGPEDTTRRIAPSGAVPVYGPPPVPHHPGPPLEHQETISRAALAAQLQAPDPPVRWTPILLGGGVLLAVVALVFVVIGINGSEAPSEPGIRDTITRSADGDPIGPVVPVPARLSGEAQGARVVFTWENPQPQPGDAFVWYRTEQGAPAQRHRTTEGKASVIGAGRVCIAVLLVRDDGATSPQPANACAGGQ